MPEGDTVHKVADYLAQRIENHTVRRLQMADAAVSEECTGRRVCRIFARGKHLFIELDNGLLLRSHLGMHGSWHRYREGETWQKPRRQASLEIATDEEVFVCFNARQVELMGATSVRERLLETLLGPDLVDTDVDLKLVVQRAREFLSGDTPLTDVLLDQRVAAGIGNVYKSEVLFIERHLPQTRLAAVCDAGLETCYATAAGLLRRNLGGGPRTTRFEQGDTGRLWVYKRAGRPCFRCADRIEYARLGKDHRATYWCVGCQS